MSLWYRSAVVCLEDLERRALFAVAFPSAEEQLLVELINRGRADPAAEAARYGIALNEGVAPADTIYATPKQPLAINLSLTSAAQEHSFWMTDTDTFSHTGDGGTSPHQRMGNAGYAFTGSWTSGENIAYRGSTGGINVAAYTKQLHADLFIDLNYAGRGHRINLMNGGFREIGVGVYEGLFTSGMTTFNSVMATEDFARSGTSVFLTGVAYTDALVADDFYTVGEAAANVTVTAVRTSDNATFSTTTWSSGGYSLALPAGTYTVSATNGQVGGTIVHSGVVIGSENVKRDFRPDMAVAPFATLDSSGALTVNGTDAADAVSLSLAANTITITRNGASQMFTAASVTSILVFLGDGNDQLTVGDGIMGLYCDGGFGDDHLTGGQFNDTLTGNAGKDKVLGGAGDDRLNGSGGHDKLWGETGNDRLYGHAGYDMLDGGAHVDRMWGDAGLDTLYGQGGNDQFYTLDGEVDVLYGGSGTDLAQRDDGDLISSVETRL